MQCPTANTHTHTQLHNKPFLHGLPEQPLQHLPCTLLPPVLPPWFTVHAGSACRAQDAPLPRVSSSTVPMPGMMRMP